MKYPWVSIALIIIWLGTTYIILKGENLNVSFILFIAIIGTIIVSLIGFKAPRIK